MNTITVNYISAQPGTGKTRAAIELMKRHIKKGYSRYRVGYVFYVAPTVELLQQTIDNLEVALEYKDIYCEMIHKVVGDTSRRSGKQGDYTEVKVQKVLDGEAQGREEAVDFSHGSVLFITHVTFLKLQTHSKFKDTTVIFDESRKWAAMLDKIKMTPAIDELFNKLFVTAPLKVNGVTYDYIHHLYAKPEVSHNQTVKFIKEHEQAEEYKPLRHLWNLLLPKKDSPSRMQVFVLPQGKGSKKQIIQVTLPSNPFVGFKKVYVLSAAFKSSEMCHLMIMEGCAMIDDTDQFMSKYLGEKKYLLAKGIMFQRNACLNITPLTDHNKAPSKNKLDHGILIKKEFVIPFRNKMSELSLTAEDLYTIIAIKRKILRGRLTPQQKELFQFIQEIGCQTDILKWQIEKSEKIAKIWMNKREYVGPGLIFVNSDRIDSIKNVNEKVFKFMSTGLAEGRNEFQYANVICFLAAINPNPILARLLNALLKHQGYDSDEDFVVDKAIQCIGRGNIRSHKKEDKLKKMLAIVPSKWLAERIYARLNEAPTIRYSDISKLGDYVVWDGNKKKKEERDAGEVLQDLKMKNKLRLAKHLKDPLNKKIANLRSKLAYWVKKEQTKAVKQKIKEMKTEINQLIDKKQNL